MVTPRGEIYTDRPSPLFCLEKKKKKFEFVVNKINGGEAEQKAKESETPEISEGEGRFSGG
jgi:hypothetical protein